MLGTDYDIGKNYRGLWGLYGNFSYLAPQIFRSRVRGFRSGRLGSGGFPILWPDITAGEYFVSDVSGDRARHDNVIRADASLTWRIHRQNAVSVRYQLSRRDFDSRELRNKTQGETVGIFYTLLGRDRCGTGDW